MSMYDIILKKRRGGELTEEEIDLLIDGYVGGEIPDYQVSALLMAIFFRGLSDSELYHLTMAMAYSGDIVDLSSVEGMVMDKHSTGGVADTTTLVVVPLVAACGGKVAKMSGRGLGHTGGTLDKLESIPGFNVQLNMDDFIHIVNKVGAAIVGQTGNLVPADKKLYALRDVTATVDHNALVASSVMSKKIASGAHGLVLDVKAGSGAFMKTVEDAKELAQKMVEIGKMADRQVMALVTNMDEPLGSAIGNALEVKEAIDVLQGRVGGPLKELSIELASYMLWAGGVETSLQVSRQCVIDALESGRGAAKLKEIIRAQGGDERVVDDTGLLPISDNVISIKADKSGYITAIDSEKVGATSLMLGAGRARVEDSVDHGVGIVMSKRVGSWVDKDEKITEFYIREDTDVEGAIQLFKEAIHIDSEKPAEQKLIYEVIG